jgi:hypothetical protein
MGLLAQPDERQDSDNDDDCADDVDDAIHDFDLPQWLRDRILTLKPFMRRHFALCSARLACSVRHRAQFSITVIT